jgi:hypothetical protein
VARIESGERRLSLVEGMSLATILTTATMAARFAYEPVGWADLVDELDVAAGVVVPASSMPAAVVFIEGAPAGCHPDYTGLDDARIAAMAELPNEAVQRAAAETWGHTATAEAVWHRVSFAELVEQIAPAVDAMYDALGLATRLMDRWEAEGDTYYEIERG